MRWPATSDRPQRDYRVDYTATVSWDGTSDRVPHAAHRMYVIFRSWDVPTISVRWLPHFGQRGGGVCAAVFLAEL
jgi:hypothetical protein